MWVCMGGCGVGVYGWVWCDVVWVCMGGCGVSEYVNVIHRAFLISFADPPTRTV